MSSSCFHVYCSICETPKVSAFSKSLIGASRPARTHVPKKQIQGTEDQMAQLGEWETEEQHEDQQHVRQPEPSMVGGAGGRVHLRYDPSSARRKPIR